MKMPTALTAGLAGAAAAYLFDPQRGRTRRTQLRDRFAGTVRRRRRRIERELAARSEYMADRMAGIAHEAMYSGGDHAPENDRTLVDKVRSEVLGEQRFRSYTLNVDACDGIVTLRGQVDDRDVIRALCDRVAQVRGVIGVESYLHTPGSEPPNKHDARRTPAH